MCSECSGYALILFADVLPGPSHDFGFSQFSHCFSNYHQRDLTGMPRLRGMLNILMTS